MKSLEEIKKTIGSHRDELKNRFFVREIGLFGSYVRGEESDKSDLDVLVELEKPVGFFKFLELHIE